MFIKGKEGAMKKHLHTLFVTTQASANIARAVLTGKIANSRTVLQRALRDHADKMAADEMSFTVKRLSNHLDLLNQNQPLSLGVSGNRLEVRIN
jgi:CRISPR-associated protein Cas1